MLLLLQACTSAAILQLLFQLQPIKKLYKYALTSPAHNQTLCRHNLCCDSIAILRLPPCSLLLLPYLLLLLVCQPALHELIDKHRVVLLDPAKARHVGNPTQHSLSHGAALAEALPDARCS
jgi:hypothetical protein